MVDTKNCAACQIDFYAAYINPVILICRPGPAIKPGSATEPITRECLAIVFENALEQLVDPFSNLTGRVALGLILGGIPRRLEQITKTASHFRKPARPAPLQGAYVQMAPISSKLLIN